ncbi:hypothetical protein [Mycolicibacterium llatzerense]|uniref:hypothetical protein n=1 Tax=Mycolicibacterium llatzerense TaxID=280871 RepID=UPI0021B6851E|nr:hypothetical protein [Mycolicibacterium llatzerense]MCT7369414.1 hypothetical protein [Mycolicibacterium llatzerense]
MNGVLGQRIQDALRGPDRSASPLAVYQKFDRDAADLRDMRDTLARAVRDYECECGETTVFAAGSTLEDYAELNQWLGHHRRCGEVAAAHSEASRAAARAIVTGLIR